MNKEMLLTIVVSILYLIEIILHEKTKKKLKKIEEQIKNKESTEVNEYEDEC